MTERDWRVEGKEKGKTVRQNPALSALGAVDREIAR